MKGFFKRENLDNTSQDPFDLVSINLPIHTFLCDGKFHPCGLPCGSTNFLKCRNLGN